jgi:outer membrane protein OmpA-like peptidoglycan-associated protein
MMLVELIIGCGGAADPAVRSSTEHAHATTKARPAAAAAAGSDTDGDGVVDGRDRCVSEAETVNGKDDDDGCPDLVVVVESTSHPMTPIVRFDPGSAELRPDAGPTLDEVAQILRAHPELTLIEVEGHADRGDASAGAEVAISQRRAEVVLSALVARGVDSSRLRAKGYGSYCPIAPQQTAEGGAQNRRVGFKVVKDSGRATSVQLGCELATKAGRSPDPIP